MLCSARPEEEGPARASVRARGRARGGSSGGGGSGARREGALSRSARGRLGFLQPHTIAGD